MRRLWALLAGSMLLFAGSAIDEPLKDWPQGDTIALQATLHHVQGIDVEDGILWVSSVDRATKKGFLSRFELATGKLLKQVEVQDGEMYHPGGISLQGDSIWVPVAVYNRKGPATIQRRDKTTLELKSSFAVEDHVGCVAAGPDGLIGGNWDSRVLYRWSFDGKELGKTANPETTSYQDLKWLGGYLIASGGRGRGAGAIDWLDPNDYHLMRRVVAHQTDRGTAYTNEGMTLRNQSLYLLPEDDPSRLFVFHAPAKR